MRVMSAPSSAYSLSRPPSIKPMKAQPRSDFVFLLKRKGDTTTRRGPRPSWSVRNDARLAPTPVASTTSAESFQTLRARSSGGGRTLRCWVRRQGEGDGERATHAELRRRREAPAVRLHQHPGKIESRPAEGVLRCALPAVHPLEQVREHGSGNPHTLI